MPITDAGVGLIELEALGTSRACLGRVVQFNPAGQVLVDYPGNLDGPVVARFVEGVFPPGLQSPVDAPVLLIMEEGKPSAPIIIGVIRDRRDVPAPVGRRDVKEVPGHAGLEARQIVLEAGDELVLRCGRGSITLWADGTIKVKGSRVMSRSHGVHAIKGALVKIN